MEHPARSCDDGGAAAGGNAKTINSASILMTGGNVSTIYGGGYAYGDSTSVDSAKIAINGGTVGTIYGGGRAQWCSDCPPSSSVGTSTIIVNGGEVGTIYASSYMAGRETSNSVASARISVTGGTISNIKENAGKSNNSVDNTVTVTGFAITGGSIASSDISITPTNGETTPQNVTKHELTFKDKDEANIVPNTPLSTLTTDAGYSYGMNDVKTDANGKIYVWLPDGVSVSGAESASGDEYEAGSVTGVLKHKEVYTISFSANGGTGEMAEVSGVLGEYTLPANGVTAPSGKQFKGWATSVDGTVISGTTIDIAADTTLYAIWEYIPVIEYDITVTDGKATLSTGTEISRAAEGMTVTLTANATASGNVFDKWEVVSGDITLADASNTTTTFTMPAGAVSVRATYKEVTHTHTSSDWKSDSVNHWKECTVVGCGVEIDGSKAAHTAGDWITDTAATSTTDGTKHKECTVCGYVMETDTIPATGGEHTHSYGETWNKDASKHWKSCTCGERSEEAAHIAGD